VLLRVDCRRTMSGVRFSLTPAFSSSVTRKGEHMAYSSQRSAAGMMLRRNAKPINVRSVWFMRMLLTALPCLALALVLPNVHAQTGIAYLTGGIGADEAERLQAREREFNLKLVFTLVEGNYVSDVSIVVKDKTGNPVLVLHAPGPLMLAKLPRGAYIIDATYEGKTQSRKVDVSERMRTEYLRWPTNPDTDFAGPKATERPPRDPLRTVSPVQKSTRQPTTPKAGATQTKACSTEERILGLCS
jgi:hypothetical protein